MSRSRKGGLACAHPFGPGSVGPSTRFPRVRPDPVRPIVSALARGSAVRGHSASPTTLRAGSEWVGPPFGVCVYVICTHACMHACMYTYIYIYIYIHTYTYTYTCACACTCTCTCTYAYVYVYACLQTKLYM